LLLSHSRDQVLLWSTTWTGTTFYNAWNESNAERPKSFNTFQQLFLPWSSSSCSIDAFFVYIRDATCL
jgi:hypothetical protein